jgi:hypothetical protein
LKLSNEEVDALIEYLAQEKAGNRRSTASAGRRRGLFKKALSAMGAKRSKED